MKEVKGKTEKGRQENPHRPFDLSPFPFDLLRLARRAEVNPWKRRSPRPPTQLTAHSRQLKARRATQR
jgi:hypothetical protein